MSVTESLLELLAEAPGTTLDAVALGALTADRDRIDVGDTLAGASTLELCTAVDAWYAAEAAGWAAAQVMVFAASVDAYPQARVIAVRPAQGSPSGALIVTVRLSLIHISEPTRRPG